MGGIEQLKRLTGTSKTKHEDDEIKTQINNGLLAFNRNNCRPGLACRDYRITTLAGRH